MSKLENLTKPILGPMVDGAQIELTGNSQVLLRAWALKTLMVFDHIGDNYWRQEERELLRTNQATILQKCTTVAADYSGSAKANAQPTNRAIRRLSGEVTDIPSFRGILTVGRALLMVDADRYKEITGRESLMWPPRYYERTVLLESPTAPTINWPLSISIDDEAFLEFTGAVPWREKGD